VRHDTGEVEQVPREGDVPPHRAEPPLPFAASVHRDARGGWLAEVTLAEGASLTKWFATEEDALRYPQELAEWLRGHKAE
jgi:hypothetical protein